MPAKNYTIRLSPELRDKLEKKATKQKRKLSCLVINTLWESVRKK